MHDHHVAFTREDTIAEIATAWRNAHDGGHKHSFDITEFVETTLRSRRFKALKIEFYDRAFKQDDPAYVSFDPLTLHVDRTIWKQAKAGDGYARFVIAHEVGHVVLHGYSDQAFSNDPALQLRHAEKEHSAEWQANTFAAYFLLPDHKVESFIDEELLVIFCQVPRQVATERLISFKESRSRTPTGDACGKCGNFTLVRIGTSTKCLTCRSIIGHP